MTAFNPTFHIINEIDALPLAAALKEEPTFYQSSIDFVREHGGPITQKFLDALPLKENVLIDIRKHKLSAGYYPAIPGYHLDWLPRKNKGQDTDISSIPDYEHVILILAETSLTEYVDESIIIPNIPETKVFEYCNDFIKASGARTWHVQNGDMVYFTSHDWHRASPAEGNEWRFFIRASKLDKARYKPVNQITTQSQVYIPIKEAIW